MEMESHSYYEVRIKDPTFRHVTVHKFYYYSDILLSNGTRINYNPMNEALALLKSNIRIGPPNNSSIDGNVGIYKINDIYDFVISDHGMTSYPVSPKIGRSLEDAIKLAERN